VKNSITRIKGHTTLWWDEFHEEKRRKGKDNTRVGIEWWPNLKVSLCLRIIN